MSAASSTAAPESPPKRRRRWWRWLWRLVLVLAALLLAARIALPYVLPSVLESVFAGLGLSCRYDDLDLSLMHGDVRLRNLELARLDGGGRENDGRFARVEYAGVDIDMGALVSGSLRVQRLELDGIDLWLARDAGGGIDVPWGSTDAGGPEPEVADAPPAGVVEYTSPVVADAVRVHRLRVHLSDLAAMPPSEQIAELDLDASHVGDPRTPASLRLRVRGRDVVEELVLEAEGRADGPEAHVDAALDVRGLQAAKLPFLWQLIGIETEARVLAMRLEASAHATAVNDSPGASDVDLRVDGLRVLADGVEQVALDSVAVESRLGPGLQHVKSGRIEGLRGGVSLLAGGGVRVGCIDIGTGPDAGGEDAAQPPAAAETVPWRFDAITATGLDVSFRDEALSPPLELGLRSGALDARGVRTGPELGIDDVDLRGRFPGIAREIAVRGQLDAAGDDRGLRVEVDGSGVGFEILAPFLREAGLEPTLRDGDLRLAGAARISTDATGVRRGSAELTELVLSDSADGQRSRLLSVGDVEVRGFVDDPVNRLTRIGHAQVGRFELPVKLDNFGELHACGVRTRPPDDDARSPSVEAAAQGAATPSSPPARRFELDELAVGGVRVSLRDESCVPPVEIALDDLVVDARGIALGSGDERKGEVEIRMRGSLADELRIAAAVTAGAAGDLDARVDLDIEGEGLRLMPLEPYLRPLGLQPSPRTARLRATASSDVQRVPEGGLALSGRLDDLLISGRDGEPLFALAGARLDDAKLSAGRVHVGRLALDGPVVAASRTDDGRLLAAGFFAVPVPAAPLDVPAPDRVPPSDAPPPVIAVDDFVLAGAELRWRDFSRVPPLERTYTLKARVQHLDTSAANEPAAVSVTAGVAGAAVEIGGDVTATPDDLGARLALAVRGIDADALGPYLPASVTTTMQDGRLRADVRARWKTAEPGGRRIELVARELTLEDGAGGGSLLACGAVRLLVARFDPGAAVYEIEEIGVQGLELDARRTSTTAFSAAGFTYEAPRGGRDPDEEAPLAGAPQPGAGARAGLPRVAVDEVDVDLRRLTFVDAATGTAAPPVEIRLRLRNEEPAVLLDRDTDALKPITLAIRAAATPVVERIDIDVEVAPFEPSVAVDLAVAGIRGPEIARVLPTWARVVRADGVEDGRIDAHVELALDVARRGGRSIDPTMGFGASLVVEGVAFRSASEGPVMAGVDVIRVEASRIAQNEIRIDTVDVGGLRGRVLHDEDGLHLGGLSIGAPAEPAKVAAAVPASAETGGETSDVRVAELVVNGLDFEYRDTRTEPPFVLPLQGLEVEVEDVNVTSLGEGAPLHFTLSVAGGDVALPVREEERNLIVGILSTAGQVVTGGEVPETQQRPVFDELSAAGDLVLHPFPRGGVHLELTALELGALRALAAAEGIQISDGLVDLTVDTRFRGERGAYTSAIVTFAHLAVSEPSDGPIARTLRLRVPLNTALFLLRDDRGEITVPLEFETDVRKFVPGALARKAIEAFGVVLANAVARSPFRIGGAVTSTITDTFGGLVGWGGGSGPGPEEQAVAVTFERGDPALTVPERERLRSIADLLLDDAGVGVLLHHEFAPADMERASEIANPDRSRTLEVVSRLRERRVRLLRRRDEALADARAHYAAGRSEKAALATAHLQSLSEEIAVLDGELGSELALLRPGAERRKVHRTRQVALRIAHQRLAAARQWLLTLCGASVGERIEIRRPRIRSFETDEDHENAPERGTVIAIPRRRRS